MSSDEMSVSGIIGVVLLALSISLAVGGWAIMLVIGILYNSDVVDGTLSYGSSIAVWALLGLAFGLTALGSRKSG